MHRTDVQASSLPQVTDDGVVLPLLNAMLDCLCAEVAQSPGGPTCFCGLVPGQQVAMDFCDCSSAATGCGMAWVRAASVFPTTQFPNPQTGPTSCVAPTAVRVEMGVTRCLPGPDANGNPPGEQAQYEAVRVQMGDLAAMRQALDCCLTLNRRDWVLGPYLPVGPSGGCGGGAFQVTVRL